MNLPNDQSVRVSRLPTLRAEVLRAAEREPVEVTGPDGEIFVLMRQSTWKQEATRLQLAVGLAIALQGPGDEPLVQRLAAQYPWMTDLTPQGRQQLADHITAQTDGDANELLAEVHAWAETAATRAEGFVADADLDWLEDRLSSAEDPTHDHNCAES